MTIQAVKFNTQQLAGASHRTWNVSAEGRKI